MSPLCASRVLYDKAIVNISVLLECLLVVFRTEIERFSLVVGADGRFHTHETDCANRMCVTQFRHLCIDLVRLWIEPALALILHAIGNLDGQFMPYIALDDAQSEIDARGDTTRRCQMSF